jgi:Domain of unknown function (DUF4440)
MKPQFLLFLLLTSCQVAFAQTIPNLPEIRVETQAESTKNTIENLERRRFEAQVEKNFPILEKIFADDLIYTHSGGKLDTKTSYINSIREGKSVYDKIDIESITVRPYNDEQTAVVNGMIFITQPTADGQTTLVHLRYAVVYIKDKVKGWQLVMWQSLKLAK